MDKIRFKLTAQWLAELLNEPKFNKEQFGRYVTKLAKEVKKPEKEYIYPKQVEDQHEDVIKGVC